MCIESEEDANGAQQWSCVCACVSACVCLFFFCFHDKVFPLQCAPGDYTGHPRWELLFMFHCSFLSAVGAGEHLLGLL